MKRLIILGWLILLCHQLIAQDDRSHFVNIQERIPTIQVDVRYYTVDNFVGARVDGYKRPVILLSKQAADALAKVQEELSQEGLGLKVFDGYRPQKGVNHFIRWAKDQADTLTKQKYYPYVNKKDVFKLGYVASKSGHSRGSTVDLTIVNLKSGQDLDMGSGWDFFGDISAHGTTLISRQQAANRLKLKSVMEKHGFRAYNKEWWHYTLRNEPFPEKYFDFDVE